MRHVWLAGAIWVFLHVSNICPVWGQEAYTVDDIAAGILAGEAQYTNLKLEYSTEWPNVKNGTVVSKTRTTATYAQQLSGSKEFLDAVVVQVGADGQEIGSPLKDAAIVFDGTISRQLDRSANQANRLTGLVVAGKAQEMNQVLNPKDYLWRFNSAMSFGELLTSNGSHMEVKGKVTIQDLECVYLNGTTLDGNAELSLWVCPARNFMPIKMKLLRRSDGRVVDEREAQDLIQIADKLWYPSRIRYGNSSAEWSTLWFEVKSASAAVLPESAFTLQFPVNTHVTDHVIRSTYTVTNDAGIANVQTTYTSDKATADAERVLQEYTTNVEKDVKDMKLTSPRLPSRAEGDIISQELWWWVGAGIAAALIAGALYGWKKGKRCSRDDK